MPEVGLALVGEDGGLERVDAALCRLVGSDEHALLGTDWETALAGVRLRLPIESAAGLVVTTRGRPTTLVAARPAGAAEQTLFDEPSLDVSPALIWLKDQAGRYARVNRRYEEVLGVAAGDLRGRTDAEVGPRAAADGRRVLEPRDEEPLEFEYMVEGFDGRPTLWSCRFIVRDAAGAPIGSCGVASPLERLEVGRAESARLLEIQRWNRLPLDEVRAEVRVAWGLEEPEAPAAGEADDEPHLGLEALVAELEAVRQGEAEAREQADKSAREADGARGRAQRLADDAEQAREEAERLAAELEAARAEGRAGAERAALIEPELAALRERAERVRDLEDRLAEAEEERRRLREGLDETAAGRQEAAARTAALEESLAAERDRAQAAEAALRHERERLAAAAAAALRGAHTGAGENGSEPRRLGRSSVPRVRAPSPAPAASPSAGPRAWAATDAEKLTAALARAGTIDGAVKAALTVLGRALEWDAAVAWWPERRDELRCLELWTARSLASFETLTWHACFPRGGASAHAEAMRTGVAAWSAEPAERDEGARGAGLVAGVLLPVVHEDRTAGVLELLCARPREGDEELAAELAPVGRQLGQVEHALRIAARRRWSDSPPL